MRTEESILRTPAANFHPWKEFAKSKLAIKIKNFKINSKMNENKDQDAANIKVEIKFDQD